MKRKSMRPLAKDTGMFVLVFFSFIVISSETLAAQTKTITPTGGGDDYAIIQNAVNGLGFGETIILNGNFIIRNTIVLKSNILWVLNGSIQLGKAVNRTMITDPAAGATNIHMSGGVYDGNLANQTTEGSCINFQKVTYSHFSDFTTQNYGKGFTFELGCNNNICDRLVGKHHGKKISTVGNGLGDRGDHNTWNDCIADSNWSDNFIIKCKDSRFNRCMARNSGSAVGFGFYARENSNPDKGADVSRNKFYACEASGNAHSGFSLNCPNNGPGAKIEDNYIQAVIYNNCRVQDVSSQAGIYLRNKIADGICQRNQLDILTYNNGSQGGIGFEATYPITGCSGVIVTYDNIPYDANIGGNNNVFNIFAPKGTTKIVVEYGNTVNFVDSSYQSSWAIEKYRGRSLSSADPATSLIPSASELKQNYPNPFNPSTTVRYVLPRRSNVDIEVFNMMGQKISLLVQDRQAAGEYQVLWNGGDNAGMQVASGVYICRMRVWGDSEGESDGQFFTKKLLLVR
ncbi:MAG: T9SS type A sorting domain-containing protein [Ignavibacteriales bacterium]|nr:T9SS type A sorting domain-containing protein [Ignavibacteriales bacterium]